MQQVLRLKPIYQDRVWGGRVLADVFARVLPEGRPIGESWEVVDRPEAQSVIVGGELDGLSLRAAIERHTRAIMGPRWEATRAFPILVKWLDCRERLSLQVHPPAQIAASLKGEPKTENWFIAACAPESHLIVGLKHGATRAQFEAALRDNSLETCVHRFAVAPGDSILVRSGQVHAIDGGNLILEIQQNSDTTYRVYDWGRTGLDGKPRQLHIAESLASIKWDDFEPAALRAENKAAVIAQAQEFCIRRVPLAKGESFTIAAGEQARILSVVSGAIQTGTPAQSLVSGDNVVLPYEGSFKIEAREPALLLITENFT